MIQQRHDASKAECDVGVLAISTADQNYRLNKCRLSLTVAVAIPAQLQLVRSIRFFAWERDEAPNDHQ